MTGTAALIRFRFYVNEHLVHKSDMTVEECSRAVDVGEGMLKAADRWLMVFEDVRGEQAPWFQGNDEQFADKVIRELFPGLKAPQGEMAWQRQHGVRLPPEATLPQPNYN